MDGNIKLFIVRKKEVMIEINCSFELLEIEKDDDADIVDEQKQISNCVWLLRWAIWLLMQETT